MKEARIRLARRVDELRKRAANIYGESAKLESVRLVELAIVTGFVCGISNEELQLLYRAVCLDYSPQSNPIIADRLAGLKGEAVKAVLLMELSWTSGD